MKGESVPKKSESTGTGLESYVAKLMGNGSNRTSVTEDEIQVALKDIDVTDEQLNAVYSALRNSGIQIISASGNDDAPWTSTMTITIAIPTISMTTSTIPARSTITSLRWPVRPTRDGFFQEQEEAHRANVPFAFARAWHRCLHGDADRRPGSYVP